MFDAFARGRARSWSGSRSGRSRRSRQTPTIGRFKSLADIPGGDAAWIGRPTAQLEVRVIDEDGNDASRVSCICRCPGRDARLHRDPERTAEVLRDGWIHTGDMVRVDDEGNLFFVDRRSDMIKTGGHERLLRRGRARALPAPRRARGRGRRRSPTTYWSPGGDGVRRRAPGAELDEAEDRSPSARETLAAYKAPKAIRVVDSLPKDTQGKILKRELRRASDAAGRRDHLTATGRLARHAPDGPRGARESAARGTVARLPCCSRRRARGRARARRRAARSTRAGDGTYTVGLTGATGRGEVDADRRGGRRACGERDAARRRGGRSIRRRRSPAARSSATGSGCVASHALDDGGLHALAGQPRPAGRAGARGARGHPRARRGRAGRRC